MAEYQVGKPYNSAVREWLETPKYDFRSGAHELVLFFNKPTSAEISAVKTGKAEFALVVQGDIIFLLYRFGTPIDWSDASYSWHSVQESERMLPEHILATGETRAVLTVILVDAANGITQAIRLVSFSPSFTSRLHQAINEQAQKPFNQASYDKQLENLYKSYPDSRDLLKLAIARSNS